MRVPLSHIRTEPSRAEPSWGESSESPREAVRPYDFHRGNVLLFFQLLFPLRHLFAFFSCLCLFVVCPTLSPSIEHLIPFGAIETRRRFHLPVETRVWTGQVKLSTWTMNDRRAMRLFREPTLEEPLMPWTLSRKR